MKPGQNETITAALNELEDDDKKDFPEDEEFLPGGTSNLSYMHNARMAAEGSVLDELLATVPKAEGFYLKLYKEMSPTRYELKDKIDDWESWSDLEIEISRIVISNTVKYPSRWGSGTYKIIVGKEGGFRGQKYKPLLFDIDAKEPELKTEQIHGPNMSQDLGSMTDTFAQIMNMVNTINPPQNTGDVTNIMANAFEKGMGMTGANKEAQAGTMNAIITAGMPILANILNKKGAEPVNPVSLMTEMMGAMQTMRANTEPAKPEKSLLDTIAEMKALGMIPEKAPERDPLEEINRMKMFMTSIGGLVNDDGGKPTATDKLIEAVAPQIPALLGNIMSAVKSVSDLQKARIENGVGGMPQPQQNVPYQQPQGRIPMERERPHQQSPFAQQRDSMEDHNPYAGEDVYDEIEIPNNPVEPQQHNVVTDGIEDPQINELYVTIKQYNPSQFPLIKEKLMEMSGGTGTALLVNLLANPAIYVNQVIDMFISLGAVSLNDTDERERMHRYIATFVNWANINGGRALVEQHKAAIVDPATFDKAPQVEEGSSDFSVECEHCQTPYGYPNEEEFKKDVQGGLAICEQSGCEGKIIPIEKN